jgi:hypothetical protein
MDRKWFSGKKVFFWNDFCSRPNVQTKARLKSIKVSQPSQDFLIWCIFRQMSIPTVIWWCPKGQSWRRIYKMDLIKSYFCINSSSKYSWPLVYRIRSGVWNQIPTGSQPTCLGIKNVCEKVQTNSTVELHNKVGIKT